MSRTGPQKYPGASTRYWYQDDWGGDAMESNVGVVHTTEGMSVPSYNNGAYAPNLTALPDIGARRLVWYQHFDFDTSARALVNQSGGVETNTLNAVQIELVGTCDPDHRHSWGGSRAGEDYFYWPDAPDWALAELAKFVRWAHDEHGVRLESTVTWRPYPSSYGDHPDRLSGSEWLNYYGWLGHSHVPENAHGDPGDLDFARVLEHATGSTQEDDVPHYMSIGRTHWMDLRPNVWDAIEFDEEWSDPVHDHWDENGSQFVRGPAQFTGSVHVRVDDLPVGAQFQVLLSEVDERGEYVKDHEPGELVGTSGDAFAALPIDGWVPDGRGIRVRVKHWHDQPVRVKAYLKAHIWKH